MSVIIKGMEMPQAGDMIICGQINGKLQCTIATRGKSTKWCEASEVSVPHGRLIDADILLDTIRYRAEGRAICAKCKSQDCQNCVIKSVYKIIREAPTVIEAEVE